MKLSIVSVGLLLGLGIASCDKADSEGAKADGKPETLEDRVSYFIGQDVAKNMKTQGFELNIARVSQGMKDAIEGDTSILTQEELDQVMSDFQAYMQDKAAEKANGALEEGKAFLEENKGKEGVQVTSSGLQYMVVEEGTGKRPDSNNVVRVHYHGTTIDGEVFDSSIDRGEPTTFPVNGVIAGWTEALLLMKEGAKYKLFIPSELAYGAQGAGQAIGPNSVLIFDVELLEVMDEMPQPGQ